MTSSKNGLPPIRVTVEIPSELALEMQRVATLATLEGASQAQVNLFEAWMSIGAQVMGTVNQSLQGANPLLGGPPRK